MFFAFVGDLHGHVLEALTVILRWQELNAPLDLVLQVGDFGIPFQSVDPESYPEGSYERMDPGQLDFARLLQAEGELAETLRWARSQLARPILFIRGNHEHNVWLDGLGSGRADPFDLFHYVPDASVLDVKGLQLGFCGGAFDEDSPITLANQERRGASPIGGGPVFRSAVDRLLESEVDLLVTHDAHYGVSQSYYGDVQGSRGIARLRDGLRPRWHVSGHLHHPLGPSQFGVTTWVQLSLLVQRSRSGPSGPGIDPRAVGILNTDSWEWTWVDDPWLEDVGGYGVQYDFVGEWR